MFCAVGCSETPPEVPPIGDSAFNPETDSPYKTEDVVKQDLMWNTASLYAVNPETKEVGNVNYGAGYENLTSFKFKSAPFSKKTQTQENTWVFATVGVPDQTAFSKPELGYPAVVLVHGGGGYVFKDWIKYWTDKGFVALALDMFSNQLDVLGNKTSNPEGGPTESDGPCYDNPNDKPNTWLYHSVNNVILCNNILRARADVNDTQIGLVGISWGGVVTNVVSGVDKRFGAFAPVYGAGYLYEDSFWVNRGGTFGGEQGSLDRTEWINHFDPSSYLEYSVKPMLFVSGVNDNCFSVTGRMHSASLPKGKVFYSQRYGLGHGNTWDQTYEIYAFMQHVLLGKDTMSQIGNTKIENGRIYFEYSNKKFDSVRLVYTTGDTSTDSHTWTFSNRLVTIRNGWCTAPENVTAYCFEFIHEGINENYKLSTPIIII